MNPELNVSYLHNSNIGYGAMGVALVDALKGLGIDVYDGLPGNGDLDIDKKNAKITRDVLFMSVPTHVNGWWKNQRSHLLTMWEATELPETLREQLHHFDTILVPSRQNLELYSRYHSNVKFVPLGVDGERWCWEPRRTDDIFFNFLIGGSGTRKGVDLAFRAFTELRDEGVFNERIPRLIMKNPKGEAYQDRDVEVVSGYLSPEDEVALYASAHCYLQPSRGEGWGLQPLQALAQGLPTILTRAHGHEAFSHFGRALSSRLVPAEYMTIYGDPGNWWEPDFDEMKHYMRRIYTNYSREVERAKWYSETVRKTFSWTNSAMDIIDAIGGRSQLHERFDDEATPGEWFTPDPKLYRVITTRNWKADIGGVTYLFEKGKEYFKPADVKRILFELKVLDTDCVDGSDGLTASQLETLGRLGEDEQRDDLDGTCHACGQALDVETRDDQRLLAGMSQ